MALPIAQSPETEVGDGPTFPESRKSASGASCHLDSRPDLDRLIATGKRDAPSERRCIPT